MPQIRVFEFDRKNRTFEQLAEIDFILTPSIGHKLILARDDKEIVFKIFDIHHNINGEAEIQVIQIGEAEEYKNSLLINSL